MSYKVFNYKVFEVSFQAHHLLISVKCVTPGTGIVRIGPSWSDKCEGVMNQDRNNVTISTTEYPWVEGKVLGVATVDLGVGTVNAREPAKLRMHRSYS